MSKTAVKTYAEQGLEEIQDETAAAEAFVNVATATTDDEGEFQQVGGLEPVAYFFRFNAPKKPQKSPFKILEKGQTIVGTYERSFTGGKFKNSTYLIRLENGELIGLPSCTAITRAMSKLAETSKVKITYTGAEVIKGGEWAGNEAHAFIVLGNKVKQS